MLNTFKCAYSCPVETDKMLPHPKNPNRHTNEQITRLAKIIDFQGWRHPIVVSTLSGFIVAGHARLEAAQRLALPIVPVDYQNFENETDEYLFMVSDNAIAEFYSETDLAAVNLEIGNLGPFDIDLLGLRDFRVEPAELSVHDDDKDDIVTPKGHICPSCGHYFTESGG